MKFKIIVILVYYRVSVLNDEMLNKMYKNYFRSILIFFLHFSDASKAIQDFKHKIFDSFDLIHIKSTSYFFDYSDDVKCYTQCLEEVNLEIIY